MHPAAIVIIVILLVLTVIGLGVWWVLSLGKEPDTKNDTVVMDVAPVNQGTIVDLQTGAAQPAVQTIKSPRSRTVLPADTKVVLTDKPIVDAFTVRRTMLPKITLPKMKPIDVKFEDKPVPAKPTGVVLTTGADMYTPWRCFENKQVNENGITKMIGVPNVMRQNKLSKEYECYARPGDNKCLPYLNYSVCGEAAAQLNNGSVPANAINCKNIPWWDTKDPQFPRHPCEVIKKYYDSSANWPAGQTYPLL